MTAAVSPRAALGTPGTVRVKGREFSVPQATPADDRRVYERMRELALRGCVHPLQSVNAVAEGLNPAVLAESVRAAVAIGSGGGVEPTREAVLRAYETLDGVRFRLWYFARKTAPGLTQEEVNGLVGEEERYEVSDQLADAHSPPAGPDAPKAPSGGASS